MLFSIYQAEKTNLDDPINGTIVLGDLVYYIMLTLLRLNAEPNKDMDLISLFPLIEV